MAYHAPACGVRRDESRLWSTATSHEQEETVSEGIVVARMLHGCQSLNKPPVSLPVKAGLTSISLDATAL